MSNISRRTALKRTALATASVVAAPMIIPSSALGRDGTTAPSERITVGMIGLGLISGGHVGSMASHPGVEVLAVCDVNRSVREKVQARLNQSRPGCDAYNEYERIMERTDIDACFVMTPDHWHVPISLAAINSGKDVYVEKPMTLTIREGRILADAVRRHGRVLQVGSQQRSEWAFRKACEIVRNGAIGKVHEVHARLGRFPDPRALPVQDVPEGLDYDRWLGPTPWMPYHIDRMRGSYGGGWRSFWEYGSRKNGDWGAHHYDIIQWALGMDDSGPTEFFPAGIDGHEYQGYRYADGPVVYRDHRESFGHMINFLGEKGEVHVSRGGQLNTKPAELRNRPTPASGEHLYVSGNHRQNFLDCIRSRKRPIADVEVAHRTASICHLSAISERLGRTIKWDPTTEQILDDPQASRWLDRPRRAPYIL